MSPDTAQEVTQGALPTVVSGITSIAGTEPGASKLMAMLPRDGRQTEGEPLIAPLDDIKDVSSFGEGALNTLFGDKLGGIVGSLSQSSGLGATRAKGVLGLLTSLVLGVLAKHVRSNNLNAQGLGQLFGARLPAPPVRESAPPVVRESALPVRDAVPYVEAPRATPVPETVTPVSRPEVTTFASERAPSRPWAWLLPASLLVAALALLWGFFQARHPREAFSPPRLGQVTPSATSPPGQAAASPSTLLEQALSPGSNVALPYRIPVDVHYQTGSADIPATANGEITALGKALATHPNARVEVVGHTDDSGDPALNQQLSERRAGGVKDALVSAGASPDKVAARGAGADATGGAPNAASRTTLIIVTSR
jgi:outer membrane protein OmpA-like peptidoglycan-associated protein